MRREKQPAGSHDKVTWRHSRNLLTRRRKNFPQRSGGDYYRTLFGISFGTYGRLRRDVLMGRRGYVPLRHLGEAPLRRGWVIHLKLV